MKYKIILFLKYYLRENISLKTKKSYLKIILESRLGTSGGHKKSPPVGELSENEGRRDLPFFPA